MKRDNQLIKIINVRKKLMKINFTRNKLASKYYFGE